MTNDINYQALANEGNPFIEKSSHQHDPCAEEMTTDTDNEDAHRDVMIHIVPDTSKGKTNDIYYENCKNISFNLAFCSSPSCSTMESH